MKSAARSALLLSACGLFAFLHASARAHSDTDRPWQPRPTHAERMHEREARRDALRDGPPSPAAQMQQNMPGAAKRGNGDPSPARQMQLRPGATSTPYQPVPESQRQPIFQNDPRRRHTPDDR